MKMTLCALKHASSKITARILRAMLREASKPLQTRCFDSHLRITVRALSPVSFTIEFFE